MAGLVPAIGLGNLPPLTAGTVAGHDGLKPHASSAGLVADRSGEKRLQDRPMLG